MQINQSIPTSSRAGRARRCISFLVLALNTSLFLLGQESRPICECGPATQHILFVGDSFTHGRYLPVRTYDNTPGTGGVGSTLPSPMVVDENFDTTVPARRENQPGETGPWGGVPGIFAELASEAGLPYNVHIEAISATNLITNYNAAESVIDRSSWDAVVLQEASYQPIPSALSKNSQSDPMVFCSAVRTIEQGVHSVAPNAKVYLYETWAPADTAYEDSLSSPFSPSAYLSALATLTAAYHDAYVSAAMRDGHIAGIAHVGEAWSLAWSQVVANPDPYGGSASGVPLSFGYQAGSEPATRDVPTDAGYHHPSIYGAYLNGLVLFQKITGTDVRSFGAGEHAAGSLGIPANVAVQLQQVAWQSVAFENNQPVNPAIDPCTLTH